MIEEVENDNYLEHYGLKRQKLASGRYERCQPQHSWKSDHRANPVRRYQTLRTFDEAPELPAGYATMIVVATNPPLWRKIMDKRVVDHYDGDVTKANI